MIAENSVSYNILPLQGFPTETGRRLDREAIACWMAAGFFLDRDSFWKEVKWERPPVDGPPWYYDPRDLTFSEAVDAFAELFEEIVREQTEGRQVILPLSGGLDSRSMAVACHRLGVEPFAFSYRFSGSFQETKYGRMMADLAGWRFRAYDIPPGYLWDKIELGGAINHCYSEFSHPRQLAVVEEVAKEGNLWLLGHWGDVLFDDMGVPDDLPPDRQLKTVHKKLVKKGGAELAADYWQAAGLAGSFDEYFRTRLSDMLNRIDIDNANARIRAFKSLHWATRWTTTNLSFFSHFKPIALPYYDDRMCRFICGIPEAYLAGRKIQIEYIRRYGPKFAALPWQDKEPYNLNNYHKHFTAAHLPWRIIDKAKRLWQEKVRREKFIQRNWEIQFLGGDNPRHLQSWLFDNPHLAAVVPAAMVRKYHRLFEEEDTVYWSHPLSTLLTLSVFAKRNSKALHA